MEPSKKYADIVVPEGGKNLVALAMIQDAEKQGLLKPGSVIIEPTSGNTGIGLAAMAAGRGYEVIIVMPDTMSKERQLLMTAYGAKLVLTEKGAAAAEQVQQRAEMAVELVGEGLSNEEKDTFFKALEVITNNLQKLNEDGIPRQ